MVRYDNLCANAHRGKVRKPGISPFALRMAEEEEKRIPSKVWAAMIRKVYEVDPMLCPECGGQMKVIAFISDFRAVDRIIEHLKLVSMTEKPAPSRVFERVALMAADERGVRIAGDLKRGNGQPSSGQFLSRADRSSRGTGLTLRVL